MNVQFKRTIVRCDTCGTIIEPDETYCGVLYITCPVCLEKIRLELVTIGFKYPTLTKAHNQKSIVAKSIHGNLIY